MEKVAYVEAYACDEYGDGPRYAKMCINQTFIDRLQRMEKMRVENDLSECRSYDAPEEWGVAEGLSLVNDELVVRGNGFWFVADPKNASYHVESRSLDIPDLISAFNSDDSVLYFGSDVDGLKDLVEDSLSDADAAQ